MELSSHVRTALGRLGVWAQVHHPVATGTVLRKLTSSTGSSHHKTPEARRAPAGAEWTGVAAAERAARVPAGRPTARSSGIELANHAARIPGCA